MDYRVVITINVTEPQLEKCWTQQWWNSVETSRNNLSGESVSWWYATLQISVRDSQVPQPTLWSQVKSVGESDYVRDCHSKTYCQFNTGPVPAVVSSTKKDSFSLFLGQFIQFKGASLSFTNEVDVSFFDRKCQVSSELVNVHLGYLATSQQSEIQTQFPLHQHLLQTNQSTSFQMYLCAHMWYLSYKCFQASTTMWSQLSIINQALFA